MGKKQGSGVFILVGHKTKPPGEHSNHRLMAALLKKIRGCSDKTSDCLHADRVFKAQAQHKIPFDLLDFSEGLVSTLADEGVVQKTKFR